MDNDFDILVNLTQIEIGMLNKRPNRKATSSVESTKWSIFCLIANDKRE